MRKELHELQWFEQVKLDVIEESTSKKYIISGPFTRCDYPNGNNRIYPKDVMQAAIEKLRPKVEAGRVRMMVDHPMWDASMRSVGAIVMEISDIDAAGYGYYKAQIIDTAAGKDLKAILDAGGKIGVSTRGYGASAYEQEFPPFAGKFDVIQMGYDLSTFDFVDDPSVSDTEAYCQLESNKRRQPMKNIEELKSAHPELMESFKAVILTEANKAADEAVAKVEAEKAEVVESNKKLTESGNKLAETVKVLAESIKAVCPELFTVVEESKLVEEAKSETEKANQALVEAQAEVARLTAEVQASKDAAVKEAKEALIKQLELEHADCFKLKSFENIFEHCVNSDEVKSVFEARFAMYTQLKSEATEAAPPKSVVESAIKTIVKDTKVELDEAQLLDFNARNKHRMANGLEQFDTATYKRLFVKN